MGTTSCQWPHAAALLAACLSLPVLAQTPGYHLIGVAPGRDFSQATGVSADGRVVAGYSSQLGSYPGFLWSEAAGRYDFGLEAGVPPTTITNSISGDGTAVAGMTSGPNRGQAFRWSAADGFQALGAYYGDPEARAEATAISGDGSVVVGGARPVWNGFTGQAFRWTQATGMQGIGYPTPLDIYSEATGVSLDGNTIVGYGSNGGGYDDAFIWTQSGGMQVLPPLPLGTGSNAAALGMNFDGTFVVGRSSSNSSGSKAVLWDEGVAVDLGVPSGWVRSVAMDVSDNGQIVVGTLATSAITVPAVWTAASGWNTLQDYLSLQGMPVPAGWLIGGFSMSADGRTFAGSVTIPGVLSQGLVITIPAVPIPGTIATAFAIVGLRRRRAN